MRIYTMLTGLMETNCYLVVTKERHIAVIDPGADPETIIAKLEDLGSEPSMILLTHAHYDHTGAVEALCKRYPDCPVMLGEKELPGVRRSEPEPGSHAGRPQGAPEAPV